MVVSGKQKIIVQLLAVMSLLLFSACSVGTVSSSGSTSIELSPLENPIFEPDNIEMMSVTPKVAEDGLIHIVMPENLLGGKSAHEVAETESDFVDEGLLDRFDLNDDGTLTYVFTPLQFDDYRARMFKFGHLHETISDTSIQHVFYHDDAMSEISVYVDRERYLDSREGLLDRQSANIVLALYAGSYQVLSGVEQDSWKCTITVIDSGTDEVISKNVFPNSTMYAAS